MAVRRRPLTYVSMRTKPERVKAPSGLARRLSGMAHELKYEAQQQEISAGGLLAGLFLLMVFALGVVVALALLALT